MIGKPNKRQVKRTCGLCGKTGKLIKTDCCGNWICDDEEKYVLFSYARNSCHRNHRRLTICAAHHGEEHKGNWKECPICRRSYPMEMYVWYATNEYNFEKLSDPPSYKPTRCLKCRTVIKLALDPYSLWEGNYLCEACGDEEREKRQKAILKKEPPAFSAKEWKKIKRLSSEKGKVYSTAKGAKKHLKSL
jgi:hypothetical protein